MLSTTAQHRPVRAAANLLLAVLMAFGFSATLAPSAQAAPQAECWTPTANGEGRGFMLGAANLKTGPYSSGCANRGYANSGERIYLHCYTVNSFNNVWWWVRTSSNNYGWTSDANFWTDSVDENGDGQVIYYQC
ncbi:hypothetical protein PV367_36545 [Streptomyces europaeiscabiei]|uniref:SH3 domain-containing protein n=1 Tax=Streptomyces europaeiscabiei TaxID=146819 RepID=A0AAJ2UQE5_9ACTN|nr:MULTISPECIES: hypothetical protein [Streptomyces]MDX3135180.1 hypothetical protein [Streptomyces europaeiscabiei]